MRRIASGSALLALILVAGCGDDMQTDMGGTADLAVPPDLKSAADLVVVPDLAPPPPDMTAPSVSYRALVSPRQEVPYRTGAATGMATVTVNGAKTQIDVDLNVSGATDIQAAHIHAGRVGTNGPVIFDLATAPFGGTLQKTLVAADFKAGGGLATFADAVAAIGRGETYINVHTTANPGGEARGQIGPVMLQAGMSGGQEIPPVTTTARATVVLKLSPMQDEIDVTINAGTLAGIQQSHIHFGPPGRNGSIIFPISGPFTGMTNRKVKAADLMTTGTPLTNFEDAVVAILGGETYANVHTTANAGGEVRGQLGAITLRAHMSPLQENPPVTGSTGTGIGVLTINGEQTQLTTTITSSGLMNVTNAHIHVAAAGSNGPVIFPLMGAGAMSPFSKNLTMADLMAQAGAGVNNFADAVNAILSGRTYFNIHTMANTGGEIRGQIPPVTLKATLTGAAEVPPVVTTATGNAFASLIGDSTAWDVVANTTGLTGGTNSHIHIAPTTASGPIIFPLQSGNPLPNPVRRTVTMSELTVQMGAGVSNFVDAIHKMISGATYVNIHTMANTGGEIRGQLLP